MEAQSSRGQASESGSQGFLHQRWVKISGIVVAVIILVLIIVPLFVNGDSFRPTAENELSAALGRRVTLGHLGFSLWSGSLVADNVTVADDPAFSAAPFFQAQSLHIGVSTPALLFHHQLEISNFTADSPQIHLISKPNGTWNYSSLGRGASNSRSQQDSASNLSIGEVKIRNGSVDVRSEPATSAPFLYNHVNLTVRNLSYTTPMPFELSADLPANGSVHLTGTAGPVAQPDATRTPLQASLEVKNFNPVAAGVVAPSDGVSMVADVNAKLRSDGKTVDMTGTLQATNLKLSANGSPAPHPVHVDLATTADIGARAGQISDLAIHTGAVAAHVKGTYQVSGQNVLLNLHLAAPGLPVDSLVELLPAVGVKLPSGSSLHGGTLTAQLDITGPAAGPRIAGPVEIDNTQLAGFALGSKIQGLASSAGSGNATDIRTLRANVVNTPQETQLSQINCEVPALGTATGNGTVSAGGALNFQLLAKLNATGGVGGAVTTALSSMGGTVGNFLHGAATNGVPLTVTGTTSNPSIRANLGSLVKQAGGTSGNSTGTKGGLLGAAQSLFNKK